VLSWFRFQTVLLDFNLNNKKPATCASLSAGDQLSWSTTALNHGLLIAFDLGSLLT
jgi:hypothetical protein